MNSEPTTLHSPLPPTSTPYPKWGGVIDRYAAHLPITAQTPVITLHEGNTPLLRVTNFEAAIGAGFELHLKYEALNPTCSFKDRGMTVAVSKAREAGAQILICASTGNTSASAAAYAARAKLQCAVILPAGNIAKGKLSQALLAGATTVAIKGNFDDALRIVRELGGIPGVEIINSINPHRIEGQKTAAFEICDQLGDAPDFHFLPVGNAGNITAYWKGYREYQIAELSDTLPRMYGYQAAGAAPMVTGQPVAHPDTIASAIRIGNPASWQPAANAINQSNGGIDTVTDAEIIAAYKLIAHTEGILVEPASAAALAGIIKCTRASLIPEGSLVVATMTGHGLKDPDIALSTAGFDATPTEPTTDAVRKAIGL